mgnify:CR=1 FL=1
MTEIDIELENKAIAKEYKNLLRISYQTLTPEDKKIIRKAFDVAVEAHKDQRRKSGEAYIFHPIAVAKIVACNLLSAPVTSGRSNVRSINLSRSLSKTILKALALPAASVPPTRVATISPSDGTPFSARIIAGIVEMRRSSTTRSFMRAT